MVTLNVVRNSRGRILHVEVPMADGTLVKVSRLLGQGDNPKLMKSDKADAGYLTAGLSLAPAKTSGFQTCPNASKGCMKACIFTSGMGGIFRNIPAARKAKTRLYFLARNVFAEMLTRELRELRSEAAEHGKRLAVRLNVFSDIAWEVEMPELFDTFADVQFYDYTKSAERAMAHANGTFPGNYHLTFSRSETNERDVVRILKAGGNVTVVFAVKPTEWETGRPTEWKGFDVVDGDRTDLRFLDERGVVVGLYAKGKGRKDTTGFVVPGRISLTMA